MKTTPRLGYLVLAMCLIGSTHAEANIWDWLEELNGPGPSRSRGNFMLNILCSGTSSNFATGRIFQIPRDKDARPTCLFLDKRWLHAEEDDRFHPVDVTITEFGTSAWLHPAVELGAGIGWMSFNSENPATDEDFEGTRLTISFPRLVFKPFRAAPFARFDDPAWGFFQMYFKETIVVGDLTQDDFASKPGTEFSRRHQRVRSMGFIIDVPSLVTLIHSAF